ncbi:conserved hypothetical protein [Desulfarculus baarsii DSM 2075]|uniref:Uncharacterized protein n=1 Tax=Desulfarculus baarsii (strain ATCC 33931 / DSM 2075 / LMG 7858 / VKM B-1802 / 2st14) TaxID=644282 RepID=E1QK45_DESB2|nr:hypothetical protein [Desulfarculus baarsii]ADK85938.1 conserved hypothetical protein [Desulfarculus baarsii DSM 2075]
MHSLIENTRIVEAIPPSAGDVELVGDLVSLKHCQSLTVLVHVNQANAATVAITLEQAQDVSGTAAKAMAKDAPIYLVADAAASDTWIRQADGVGFTTDAALKHKLVALDVDAQHLDLENGFTCLRVKVGASHAANLVAAQYIAVGSRYGGASLIVD